jgi:hypothetical protein
MLKSNCLLILLSLLSACQIQAQTQVWDRKAEDAVKNSKRLIVLLLDPTDLPNDKKFKKRPELVKAYEKYVGEFNEMIKSPIQAHWRLTKQVDFMPVRDLIAFRNKAGKQELGETLVLRFPMVEYNFMYATSSLSTEEVANFWAEKGRVDDDYVQNISLYNLRDVRPFSANSVTSGPNSFLAEYYCNRWFLTTAEIAFALENMQEVIQLKAKRTCDEYCVVFDPANKGKLATKTLLIPAEYTVKAKNGKKTIDETELKSAYPWPWRFASVAEIAEAIAKKEADKAVLFSTQYLPTGPLFGTYFWVVDAADARTILGYSTPGNLNVGVGTVAKENGLNDLNMRRVKEIVKGAQKE